MQERDIRSSALVPILNMKNLQIHEIVSFYYELYDIDNGTIHHKIFGILYIDKTYDYFDEISQNFGLDIKTLYNYRKKYEELMKKIIYISQKNKL